MTREVIRSLMNARAGRSAAARKTPTRSTAKDSPDGSFNGEHKGGGTVPTVSAPDAPSVIIDFSVNAKEDDNGR